MSPSPPPPKEHRHKRPSPLGRSLPTAPLVGRDLQRPHTSGEFRIRRYRQTSTEEKVELLLKNKLGLEVNENQSISTVVPRNPSSASAVVETEPRSSSAPVRALSRYRVLPDPPGTQRTSEDSPQPSSQTPVTQVSHGYRPGTAAAALQKRRLKPN
ncbi:uncharacterized protein LOC116308825 [Actinia tenebrosa]|uniref:Uncharacterized protein LOC116308825 n=1 Tax=Actinia tenebrosa TaxID=6105 RepID=A0A6P8J623_ACTTE|nr:uncharacterized protein LOC116308825 [Actinia tenebrosa]